MVYDWRNEKYFQLYFYKIQLKDKLMNIVYFYILTWWYSVENIDKKQLLYNILKFYIDYFSEPSIIYK